MQCAPQASCRIKPVCAFARRYFALGGTALAVTPWVADLIGVGARSLVGRVFVTAVAAAISAVLWTHLLTALGILWFVAGKGEALYGS